MIASRRESWGRLLRSAAVGALVLGLAGARALAQSATLVPTGTSYSPAGGTATFTATISYAATPTALGFVVELPPGWSYSGGTGEPSIKPESGSTGTLEWAYSSGFGATSSSFSFTASYPAGLSGNQTFTASAVYRSPLQNLSITPVVLSGATTTNTAPTISDIADRSIAVGGNTGPVAFTVGDAQTAAGSLTVSGTSSNTTLVPNGAIVFSGSGANRTVTVTPVAGQSGTATIAVTVTDGGGLTATDTFTVTVTSTAVSISPASRSVAAGGGIGQTIGVTATGSWTATSNASWLVITAGSGGSGDGTVTYSVSANTGTASRTGTITVGGQTHTVTQAAGTTASAPSASFASGVSSYSPAGGTATFTATISYAATPTALGFVVELPPGWSYSGGTGEPSIKPDAGTTGTLEWAYSSGFGATSSSFSFTASYPAGLSGNQTFTASAVYRSPLQNLSITPVVLSGATTTNTAPTISDIADRSIAVGGNTGPVAFTVGDAQTAAGSLTVSGTSSNTTLVPNGAIVFSGSGANRTVTVTPAAGQSGTATIAVTVTDGGGLTATDTFTVTVTTPTVSISPASRNVAAGGGIGQTIGVTATGSWTATSNASWLVITAGSGGTGDGTVTYSVSANTGTSSRTGTITVAGQTHTVTQPAETGRPTVFGGTGAVAGADIVHPNGNVYDQVLMTGPSVTIQSSPGKIVRTSYLDLTDDIVQVEFSGAGTVTISLAGSSGPALPAKYNQSVSYMKGHASITVQGADSTSNLTVFSVGRMTAVNQALFNSSTTYDGFADLASITILPSSMTGVGSFGGLRAANAHLWGDSGKVGLDATGITFEGPLFLYDISASGTATPMLRVTSAPDVRITGGDLQQINNQPVQVAGFNTLQLAAGVDSHGRAQPAQPIRGRLERNGQDVTVQLVPSSGMALIPAGAVSLGDSFSEGNADERPTRSVALAAFYLAKTEVTFGEWKTVRDWAVANGYTDLAGIGAGKGDTHPVQSVSWHDAVKWLNAKSEREGLTPVYYTNDAQTTVYRTGAVDLSLGQVKWTANGYRLPTEAEWEKAARGGVSGRRFPWGDTITHQRANYRSLGDASYDTSTTRGYHPSFATGSTPFTAPVGSFEANGYGVSDMAGNVWEWCWDWYAAYSGTSDPRGPVTGINRTVRGGGWDNEAFLGRVANRGVAGGSARWVNLGFRPARSVVP